MCSVKKCDRRVCGMLAAILLFISLAAGCGHQEVKTEQKQEEVQIPMILTVDPSTGKKNEESLIMAFNKEYEGIWHMDVKWVMETEEDYRQNLKRRNATDTLPAVITDLRMLPSFYNMMIADERLMELSSYIEEDEEWKDMIEPVVLESCMEKEGNLYLAPISTAFFSCSGVFWNEELFAQAGITSFPQTWTEFWECCDTLQAHGITPLAIHTEGTAWAAMLFATAELADSEEGAEFMKKLYPDSYQNESGIHLAQTLKRLFTYTTKDALYSDFDMSYNEFFSGRAAMIPNGYWMIDQIPEEWENTVRFSAFPGNKLISSPETFGWAIVESYPDDVKEGALEFIKYRTAQNKAEKERMLSENPEDLTFAERDYLAVYQGNPQFVPNYQVKWNSILQEETLGAALPDLAMGKIDAAEFTRRADESIQQFLEEQ
ncbi:ABC transporter substrate-binding protein [Mediterraneibacter agrestimuris]|uniref:ABC transporter substrate-binding protein n=1 Tax=Mediterraneibacter agrestimuris TaxID=2941333 RepID=UPI00203B10A3|nr:ABC transporter substrate-binding protein [Mediterraneibacter agrestimuris]